METKAIDGVSISQLQNKFMTGNELLLLNGKIRIGLPGINKDIVLDANDIETFKQSLVK